MKFVSALLDRLKREPAILTTIATDALGVGADLGLHLSAAQQRGVYGVCSFVTALVIRAAVTPNVKVRDLEKAAPDVGAALGQGLTADQRLAKLEAAVNELGTPKPPTAVPSAGGTISS